MAELQLPKLIARVRFPSLALKYRQSRLRAGDILVDLAAAHTNAADNCVPVEDGDAAAKDDIAAATVGVQPK